MTRAWADGVAEALLYEGYLLYPYRASALKNRYRFTFGVLYPPGFGGDPDAERSFCQTECLVAAGEHTRLEVEARFLHLGARLTDRWVEATERRFVVEPISVSSLPGAPRREPLNFPGGEHQGVAYHPVRGALQIEAARVDDNLIRVTVRLSNTSAGKPAEREDALLSSLAAAHLVLLVDGGRFVSLLEPPEPLKQAAAACANVGVWPVLVGPAASNTVMLASPIILYDHPRVAPESPGDLYDATEIDEILTLRVATLTEQEKREASADDERARRLLARTATLAEERLAGLHGALREPPAAALPDMPAMQAFRTGTKVRLLPHRRADVLDLVLKGKIATVLSVEQDLEGVFYLAVSVDEDPGQDMGEHAHRFFFRPDEVELA